MYESFFMRMEQSLSLTTQESKNISKHYRWSLGEITYLIGAAALFTFWINSPYWLRVARLIPLQHGKDILFLLSQMLLVLGVTTSILMLLCWSRLLKPMLALLFIISAACAYFSYVYQVYVDRHMLTNVMRTDVSEAKDLLSIKFGTWMLVYLLPVFVFLKWVHVRPLGHWRHKLMWRLGGIVLGVVFGLAVGMPMYKNYASFYRNNKQVIKMLTPYNFINASVSYAQHKLKDGNRVFEHVGLDAKQVRPAAVNKPTVFVLVIGETARADRFSLNDYARPTNPLLSKQEGIISFQKAASCGTATAISVPCLLSSSARKEYNPDTAAYQDNLLDVVQRAGITVQWFDNNSGCQQSCERVPHQQLKQDCPEELCFDEQLVAALNKQLLSPSTKDQFIVLHMNGSHGPAYFQRYPKHNEAFKPACNTKDISSCDQTLLNNVYDNTIVNTDEVLNGIVEVLKAQKNTNTVMVYASDHGESLGENGLYLHATPYSIAPKEQTHIPMIFWANSSFYQQHKVSSLCLQQAAKNAEVSHDNLFHTVMGGLFVHSQVYDGRLDLMKQCGEV